MEERRGQRGLESLVRRYPFVLFIVLGALLYGAWVLLAPPERETIRVEATVLRALEQQQEDLLGRPLTVDERQEIRESYIDDEVLLREALARGLQWSDFRVRQRLTRIMRGALTETVADPSVAQLQAHFRDNIERFSSPESMTLDQVFFPWGEEVTEEWLDEVLAALRSGADPAQYGSSSLVAPYRMPRQSRALLVRTFGADFADSVDPLVIGDWHGPFESVHGIHLVRVTERHPPEVAVFEDVEHYLRQEWLMEKTRELQQEGIDEIRSRYQIELVEESTAE